VSLPRVAAVELLAVCAAYASFRVYGALAAERANAAGLLRRALSVGLPLVGVLTVVALRAAGLDAAVRPLVPTAAGPVGLVVASLGGYAAAMAGYRAVASVDATVRDVPTDDDWVRTRQFGAFALLVVAAVDAVVVAARVLPGVAGAVAAIAVVSAALYAGGARAVAAVSETRRPTASERERLGPSVAADTVDRVRVLETGDTRWAGAYARGPPGSRTLFVASHLLDAHDDAGVAAVAAVAVRRAERGYFETKVVATAAVAVAVAAVLAADGALAVAGLVAYAVGCWRARRVLFDADARALAVTNRAAFVAAQRRIAADADVALDAGRRFANALRGRASRAERIDRLCDG